MLFEYMQRRSELDNETFNEIVEQSNAEERVKEFKTIFQTAREEGEEKGIEKGIEKTLAKSIKGLILTTDLSDRAIAVALDVTEELVKSIRQEIIQASDL